VEMLNSMDRFQTPPVLEPNDILVSDLVAEGLVDIVVDLSPTFGSQIIGFGIVFEVEFSPDYLFLKSAIQST
jgi:hypothetical protein